MTPGTSSVWYEKRAARIGIAQWESAETYLHFMCPGIFPGQPLGMLGEPVRKSLDTHLNRELLAEFGKEVYATAFSARNGEIGVLLTDHVQVPAVIEKVLSLTDNLLRNDQNMPRVYGYSDPEMKVAHRTAFALHVCRIGILCMRKPELESLITSESAKILKI